MSLRSRHPRNGNLVSGTNAIIDNGDKSIDLFAYSDTTNAVNLVSVTGGFIALGNFTSANGTVINNVQVDPHGRYMDSSGRVFTFITGMSPDLLGTGLTPYAATAKNAGTSTSPRIPTPGHSEPLPRSSLSVQWLRT